MSDLIRQVCLQPVFYFFKSEFLVNRYRIHAIRSKNNGSFLFRLILHSLRNLQILTSLIKVNTKIINGIQLSLQR